MEIKKIIENISGYDLTGIYKGWVLEGESYFKPEDAFIDSDKDGLYDLDENLFGTNPFLSDTDFDGIGDIAGDAKYYDIKSIYYLYDENNRKINIKINFEPDLFKDKSTQTKSAFTQIYFAVSEDKKMDYRAVL